MRMEDPIPTFAYLATQLKERYPDFAYFHAVEPRVNGNVNREAADHENIQFLRDIWAPKAFISAGGFHKENAEALADAADNNIIAFGRQFLANVCLCYGITPLFTDILPAGHPPQAGREPTYHKVRPRHLLPPRGQHWKGLHGLPCRVSRDAGSLVAMLSHAKLYYTCRDELV